MRRIKFTSPPTCTSSSSFSSFSLVRYASTSPASATTTSAAPAGRYNANSSSIAATSASKRAAAKAESLAGQGLLSTLLRASPAAAARSHQIVQPSLTPEAIKATKWTPESVRTGILGLKAGMTVDWNMWGVRKALTVVKLEDLVVTGVRTLEKHGYNALQLGAFVPKPGRLSPQALGIFASQGTSPRVHVGEFHVTPDALLPIGTPLTCRHFVPGQKVIVTGTSQGKGFQGAMKRHNFAGQGASHGNSVSHRVLGATGNRQDPGKVIKGKKMPGHMGAETITQDGNVVYKIDIKRNLLYLEGAAPGKPGTLLRIKDSLKHPFDLKKAAKPGGVLPPFPTYTITDADRIALAKWAAGVYLSPSEEAYLAQTGALPAGYEREPPFEIVAQPPSIDPFTIPENDEPED